MPIVLCGHPDVAFSAEQNQQQHRHSSKKAWWENLGGDYSSVHDWSYLLVPLNMAELLHWVASRYEGEGGMDALVAVSGRGRIVPCRME